MINKVLLICTLLSIVSCSFFENKNSYIGDYSNFINEVSLNGDDYSDEEWNESDSLYVMYSSNLFKKYKSELNKNEREMVNKLTGKYFALRSVSVGKGILSDIEDFGIQMESMIEAVLNELEIDSIKN